jgi:HAD superfamily hydrolase (TIGR01456 family)
MFSSAASIPQVAVAFDIDGVLIRGKDSLQAAAASLKRLDDAQIPWICLTNGGGVLEDIKAKEVSAIVGHPIETSQMICCHTPYRGMVQEFGDKRVLILGCRDVMGVARAYGFKDAVCIDDLAHDDPTRYPFLTWEHKPLAVGLEERPVEAVFVFHDPVHWAQDLQITIDCLRRGSPLGTGRSQAIPFFHANPDLIFAGLNPAPRLASGAFLTVIRHLFKEVVGVPLEAQLVGKPEQVTFDFAHYTLARRREHVLRASSAALTETDIQAHPHVSFEAHGEVDPPFQRLFMVGDNPSADIRGANNAGGAWESVLVRTGVFQGGENDENDPGMHVVDGVEQAVDIVLEASRR